MNPEEIFGKDYNEFSVEDPFNENYVEGYISRQSTDLYGALDIDTKMLNRKNTLLGKLAYSPLLGTLSLARF